MEQPDDVVGEETVLIWATISPSIWWEKKRAMIDSSKFLPAADRKVLREELVGYFQEKREVQQGTLRRLTFQHEPLPEKVPNPHNHPSSNFPLTD